MQLNEYETDMRARATRIESRLVKVAQSLGIETGNPAKGLKLRGGTPTQAYVHTESRLVNFADVEKFLTDSGIEGKVALVYYDGQLLARIYPRGAD